MFSELYLGLTHVWLLDILNLELLFITTDITLLLLIQKIENIRLKMGLDIFFWNMTPQDGIDWITMQILER